MAHIEYSHVTVVLPDGRTLFHDVGFRVGEGTKTALIAANGAGKTTLLRLLAGELEPDEGAVKVSGTLALMPQFIGHGQPGSVVRDLFTSISAPSLRAIAGRLAEAERRAAQGADEAVQMAYADALGAWEAAGGYDAELLWDMVTQSVLGIPFHECRERSLDALSGGEQKRLALEALLGGPADVLALDEPDNYLDVPGKEWLEQRLAETPKTVLFVSHDRELVARTAERIVTLEGRTAWTHGGRLATYEAAREARIGRMEELHRRWGEERARLRDLVVTLRQQARISPDMASRYKAMQTRLAKFEEAGPPQELPRRQRINMRLGGSRTGERVITCEGLELLGLMKPFDCEVFYRERVGVLGGNGSGKSHFLRLLAEGGAQEGDGGSVRHRGVCKLGARVVPGHFSQTQAHPEWLGLTLREILGTLALDRSRAMGLLKRYELQHQAEQRFETLSGGQQARLQIAVLEVKGTTLLLLDEPTDNLDLDSAEALECALAAYEGTTIAVTHDRWFARAFDRFLVFGSDGCVYESATAVWHERRPVNR